MDYLNYKVNPPQWREVATSSHLPAGLEHLKELSLIHISEPTRPY